MTATTIPRPLAGLAQAQRELVLMALADAIEARRERAGVHCDDCSVHPAGLCEDHAADLDRADDYDALRRELEAGQ